MSVLIAAIRGATTVEKNSKTCIIEAVTEMLQEILHQNGLQEENLISLFFTMTQDLDAVFPAEAARNCGIVDTALMCAVEIPVPDSLPKCIRVLVYVNTSILKKNIVHVYLRKAKTLRPDLVGGKNVGSVGQ